MVHISKATFFIFENLFLSKLIFFESALKEINSDTPHKKDINALNEVKILRDLDHEHIIKCIDCFVNEDVFFYTNCIVSEFCEVA
jgi:serine/threonine protein kinase